MYLNKSFCGNRFSFLLSIDIGVGHGVVICLTLYKTTEQFPQVWSHFTLPSAGGKNSKCPLCSPTFGVVSGFVCVRANCSRHFEMHLIVV